MFRGELCLLLSAKEYMSQHIRNAKKNQAWILAASFCEYDLVFKYYLFDNQTYLIMLFRACSITKKSEKYANETKQLMITYQIESGIKYDIILNSSTFSSDN